MRPKCIILDEATAMLDPVGRKDVLDTIVRLNKKEHITVILITHYMEEVTLADYVYVMKQGKVAYSGTPGEVFQNVDMLRECRLEAPQVTQIAQGLQKAGIPLSQGVFTIEGLAKELLGLAKKR